MLRLKLIELKDQIIDFTLPVEAYKVDGNLFILNGKEKIKVTKNDYGYNSDIGFYCKKGMEEEAIFW